VNHISDSIATSSAGGSGLLVFPVAAAGWIGASISFLNPAFQYITGASFLGGDILSLTWILSMFE
jgi:hypothetical protein